MDIRPLLECGNLETTPKEVKEAHQLDFYIDDTLTIASSASRAKGLQLLLISTLKQAQFNLRKRTSKDSELFLSLPPEVKEAREISSF